MIAIWLPFVDAYDAGLWLFWICETEVVAVPRPAMQIVANRLHCDSGPAVQWPDGHKFWFWRGVNVDERLIINPDSYTQEDIRSEKNSEVSRAIAERIGWDRYLDALGAMTVDSWIDPKTGLHYELIDTNERRGEMQPRWLRMQSPTLHDGTQPHYLEPVDPRLVSARAARAWQLFDWDPNDPDGLVGYCNRKPNLEFIQET